MKVTAIIRNLYQHGERKCPLTLFLITLFTALILNTAYPLGEAKSATQSEQLAFPALQKTTYRYELMGENDMFAMLRYSDLMTYSDGDFPYKASLENILTQYGLFTMDNVHTDSVALDKTLTELAEIDNDWQHGMMLSAESNFYVRRADERVLSLLNEYYTYLGGAHGYHALYGKCYDVKSGKELSLTDIFTDGYQLAEVITQDLRRKYSDASFNDTYGDTKEELRNKIFELISGQTISWILDQQGVTFIFNQYDIASYAEGKFFSHILYQDHPSLFKEKYKTVPSEYAVELTNDVPIYVNLKNGKLSKLTLNVDYDYAVISLDNNTYHLDGIELNHVYLLALKDGRRYIYVDFPNSESLPEFNTIKVFDITSGKVKYLGEKQKLSSVLLGEDGVTTYPITNPNKFYLFNADNISREYKIGKDGFPMEVK